MATTHMMSKTPFYRRWAAMLARCKYPSQQNYVYYGGRGIRVEWKTFEQFKQDMYDSFLEHISLHGYKQTWIDRIDSTKNYSKENCRWATISEQQLNRNYDNPPLTKTSKYRAGSYGNGKTYCEKRLVDGRERIVIIRKIDGEILNVI